MSILKQRLFQIHIFQEVYNGLLKIFAHLATNALLNDPNYLVIVFHPKYNIAHSLHPQFVRLLLKFSDDCKYILSVG